MSGKTQLVEWEPDLVLQAADEELQLTYRWAGDRIANDARTSLVERSRRSLPGETPTSITGGLRSGIVASVSTAGVAVGVLDTEPGDVPYFLEQSRPYLAPAMQRSLPDILSHLEKA